MWSSSEISRVLFKQAKEVVQLRKKDGFSLMQSWREHFSSPLFEEEGIWRIHEIDWHTFSYGYTPCESGETATSLYMNETADRTIVHCPPSATFEVLSRKRIDIRPDTLYLQDWYIFHPDLAWTYVVTHESDYGPYFSRDEWVLSGSTSPVLV